MAHSKLSPSASARWLNCPGSVAALEAMDLEWTSSPYADEGTNVHTLCEHYLQGRFDDPADLIGTVYKGDASPFEVTPKIAENVEIWKSYIYEHVKPTDSVFAERKVHLFYREEDTGTADCVAFNEETKTLHVFDYKNGQGVFVPVENNTQLRVYAISAMLEFEVLFDIEKIMYHVVQPNKQNCEGEEMTLEEADAFIKSTCKSADLIGSGKPMPRVAGEKQCLWCDYKHTCKEYQQFNLDLIGMDFEDLSDPEAAPEPDPVEGDMERLAIIYSKKKMIESWLKSVEAKIFSELEADPEAVPGYKLVEGNPKRCWVEDVEADLIKFFRSKGIKKDEYMPPKLITAPQSITLLKARKSTAKSIEKLNSYITKTKPKLSIAPESDKRPAVTPAIDDFDVI